MVKECEIKLRCTGRVYEIMRCQINTCQKIVHTVKTRNSHSFDTRIQFPIYGICNSYMLYIKYYVSTKVLCIDISVRCCFNI